jgi:hypothetical protein
MQHDRKSAKAFRVAAPMRAIVPGTGPTLETVAFRQVSPP